MIREAILQRMGSIGMSQVGLCRDLGLVPQNINAFLHGNRPLPYDTLVSVLSYLRLGLCFAEHNTATLPATKMRQVVEKRILVSGLTLKDASAFTGINAGTLSSFINGRRSISNNCLEILMKKLKMDIKPLKKATEKC